MLHRLAGVAEHDGAAAVIEEQRVDDGILALVRLHQHQLVVDVGMALARTGGDDAHRVALVGLGQLSDLLRHGRREHQRAAAFRCGGENEFEVLAEAHVEHLVRLVQHHGTQLRQVQRTLGDVVAQAARRSHHDVGATVELADFLAHVHAAHAACRHGARIGVEPAQLALDLKRQFACGRNDQRQRALGRPGDARVAQKCGSDGEAEGHRLARAGLGGDQQVIAGGPVFQHGGLDRRQAGIALPRQRRRQCGMHAGLLRRGRNVVGRGHHAGTFGSSGSHPARRPQHGCLAVFPTKVPAGIPSTSCLTSGSLRGK